MSELKALDELFSKLTQNATPVDPLEGMNGVEVLWYLLTNWDAGKGLWIFIGIGVFAFILSLICDKYMDDKELPPVDQSIGWWR